LISIVPEIFERRLLSRWEKMHGHTAERRQQGATTGQKKQTNGESPAARHIRLVLEQLKARAARAADEVVDTHKSAMVIKKLCLEMEEELAPPMKHLGAELGLSEQEVAEALSQAANAKCSAERVRPIGALPSGAMQAASTTVQRSTDEKPRVALTQSQIQKLQKKAAGIAPGASEAYEQLRQACEVHHLWCWMPDQRISIFWQVMPAKDQEEILEVESRGFRDLLQEHVGFRTCYCKKFLSTSLDIGLLDDGHSVAALQDFFRNAAFKNTCVELNWQTAAAMHDMIQESKRAQGQVDSNTFPHGSYEHKEHEHTRLAVMCMVPEIFERRLLSKWERAHGKTAQMRTQPASDKKKAPGAESSAARHTRLVLESLQARATKAAEEKTKTYAKCVRQPNEGSRTNSDDRRLRPKDPVPLRLQLTLC